MSWVVVAFLHPFRGRALLYRQNLKTRAGVLKAVETAMDKGANLMSLRRVEEDVERGRQEEEA